MELTELIDELKEQYPPDTLLVVYVAGLRPRYVVPHPILGYNLLVDGRSVPFPSLTDVMVAGLGVPLVAYTSPDHAVPGTVGLEAIQPGGSIRVKGVRIHVVGCPVYMVQLSQ